MRPLLLREFTRLGRSIACNILHTTQGVTLASGQLGVQRGLERRTYCNSTARQYAVDCVVVGAGVIGLACARAAALAGFEVVLLEQEAAIGTATSSRHSEVIHAGIYYPHDTLKARLCVEGKHMLYEYCRARGVPFSNLGKLIVATDAQQVPKLQQLKAFAAANGVADLQLLSGSEATSLEPALSAAAALLSPSTGIINSHSFMESLLADAAAAGAVLATHSQARGAHTVLAPTFTQQAAPSHINSCSSNDAGNLADDMLDSPTTATGSSSSSNVGSIGSNIDSGDGGSGSSSNRRRQRHHLLLHVEDTTTGEVSQLCTRWMVNAAGLQAQAVACGIQALDRSCIPRQYLAKGNYFSLTGTAPFSRLIYPVPVDGGLGVHLTLDLAGQAKFGPDVEWVTELDYSVDPARAESFYPSVRSYYPDLPDGALQPSYSGIRPKISGPGQPAADFLLQGPQQHGVDGVINLFGIESPGLTSSLAVAETVVGLMRL